MRARAEIARESASAGESESESKIESESESERASETESERPAPWLDSQSDLKVIETTKKTKCMINNVLDFRLKSRIVLIQ